MLVYPECVLIIMLFATLKNNLNLLYYVVQLFWGFPITSFIVFEIFAHVEATIFKSSLHPAAKLSECSDKEDDEIMEQVGSSDGFLSFNMTCGPGCVVEYRGSKSVNLYEIMTYY